MNAKNLFLISFVFSLAFVPMAVDGQMATPTNPVITDEYYNNISITPAPLENFRLPIRQYDWDDVAGALSYLMIIAMVSPGGTTVYLQDAPGGIVLANSEFTPAPCEIKSNGHHYWRVAACANADGTGCGPFSDWQYLTRMPPELFCVGVSDAIIGIDLFCNRDPDEEGPLKNEFYINPDYTLYFYWCEVPEVNSYFFLATTTDYLAVPGDYDVDWGIDPETPTSTLESYWFDYPGAIVRSTDYDWRVASCRNLHGVNCDYDCNSTKDGRDPCTDYSQSWQFNASTTVTGPRLIAPTSSNPIMDPPVVNTESFLEWQGPIGAFSYTVYIKDWNGNLIMTLTTTTANVYPFKLFWTWDPVMATSTLEPARIHYWQVKSCWNPKGTTCAADYWSNEWLFLTTGMTPYFDEAGSGPTNNAWVSIPTKLNWDDVRGALRYRYQVSATSTFTTTTIFAEGLVQPSEVFLDYPTLKMYREYYWRVQSCADKEGLICGDFTDVRKFNTLESPWPELLSPEFNETTYLPIFLKWKRLGEELKLYRYRKAIKIINLSLTAITNEKILIVFRTDVLLSENKVQPDLDDIRFVDSDETTILKSQIETDPVLKAIWGPAYTLFWVKIPFISAIAGENEKIIYAYYGNPSASSYSTDLTTLVDRTLDTSYPLNPKEEDRTVSQFGGWRGDWYFYELGIMPPPNPSWAEGVGCCAVYFSNLPTTLDATTTYHWMVKSCLAKVASSTDIVEINEKCGLWSPDWIFYLIKLKPPAWGGFVPCGRMTDDPNTSYNEEEPCQIKHFFLMLKIILDFVLWRLLPIILVILVVIIGILYYFSFGSPQPAIMARSALKAALIGFLIIFFAWVIITWVLGIFGITIEWWEITL